MNNEKMIEAALNEFEKHLENSFFEKDRNRKYFNKGYTFGVWITLKTMGVPDAKMREREERVIKKLGV